MANDNEKLIPLFFPCYLVAIGIITLTGISLIDPALLESANWKQNTIWSALLFSAYCLRICVQRKVYG